MVETALVLPVLLIALLGVFDLSRALLATTVMQSAVQAGADYGALSETNAADSAAIAVAVRTEAALSGASATNPSVTSATATDAQGDTQLTVRATFTLTPVVAYPGLPPTFAITRTAVAQVRR